MGQTERTKEGATWSSLDYNTTQQTNKQRNDFLQKTGQHFTKGSLHPVNSNQINFKDSVVTFSMDQNQDINSLQS